MSSITIVSKIGFTFRDDTHMKSMKNVKFSKSHTVLVQLGPILFHPLHLGRPIPNEAPSHCDMWSGLSFRSTFFFQYQLINLVWLSTDFFPLSWKQPRPQSYFKIWKTFFSLSSSSKKDVLGSRLSWSLTICFFGALYSWVCSCPKISRNVFYL